MGPRKKNTLTHEPPKSLQPSPLNPIEFFLQARPTLCFPAARMKSVSIPARRARAQYRHELRTLAYVTLDDANGGIVRNLNPQGVRVQAVAALQQKQSVRIRFELKSPRLRVDSRGEVAWADPSGQCGIRFVDLPARSAVQIKEWIFGELLGSIFRENVHDRLILQSPSAAIHAEDDGLILSSAPRPAIQLQAVAARPEPQPVFPLHREDAHTIEEQVAREADPQLDWLSRPLSGRTLALLVDSLIMIAAFLVFSFVFLSITHELPRWPLGLAAALGAAIFVPASYCGFTYAFGRSTLGARLAQIAGHGDGSDEQREEEVRLR